MNMTVWDRLRAPFDPNLVHWRVGSTNKDKTKGLALAYLDARDIQERLDDAVGPENWEDEYKQAGSSIICRLRIRIETPHGWEWIAKSDGSGESDIEGSKGAISGALKRAAVKFGIGRYLYYTPDFWRPLEQGKWFSDNTKRSLTLDLGAWQRDFFAGQIDGEIRENVTGKTPPAKLPPQQPKAVETKEGSGVYKPAPPTAVNGTPAPDKQIDEAYKDFRKELDHANAARREEGLGQILGTHIIEALHQMNYGAVTPKQLSNWSDLKMLGYQGLVDLTRELNEKPTLIGEVARF
jgi:hypothetical protein